MGNEASQTVAGNRAPNPPAPHRCGHRHTLYYSSATGLPWERFSPPRAAGPRQRGPDLQSGQDGLKNRPTTSRIRSMRWNYPVPWASSAELPAGSAGQRRSFSASRGPTRGDCPASRPAGGACRRTEESGRGGGGRDYRSGPAPATGRYGHRAFRRARLPVQQRRRHEHRRGGSRWTTRR